MYVLHVQLKCSKGATCNSTLQLLDTHTHSHTQAQAHATLVHTHISSGCSLCLERMWLALLAHTQLLQAVPWLGPNL